MVHYNIIVIGKVQGVSFRQYTKTAAHNLKIKGFVKNLQNGNVYIEAEGADDSVMKFVDWCHIGSPKSSVESVEIETSKLKRFENFEIRQ